MLFFVGIGGMFGAMTRFILGKYISSKHSVKYPVGTWIINITGALILGILTASYINHKISDNVWYILGVGFCGAYTTFSTFGYETIGFINDKNYKMASFYVLSSISVGIIVAQIGYSIYN